MSDDPIIPQEIMAALLGRPLAEVEKNNYDLYLEIAVERLDDLLCIKLEAMNPLPADLKLVIARCFATILAEQKQTSDHGVQSKKVEDFSITFDAEADSPMVLFVNQNSSVLDKYSQCQGAIRSGVCSPCGGCYGDCI